MCESLDIIAALLQQPDYQTARNYWKVLKNRLKKEGSQTVTDCNRLKMVAHDGKLRFTDVASPETLLRIMQSVPSPRAEPIKLWLAKVGYERMQDMSDPARALDRAREFWRQYGRSEKWIQQRMMGQETRNKLTDYRKTHSVEGENEYAMLLPRAYYSASLDVFLTATFETVLGTLVINSAETPCWSPLPLLCCACK